MSCFTEEVKVFKSQAFDSNSRTIKKQVLEDLLQKQEGYTVVDYTLLSSNCCDKRVD